MPDRPVLEDMDALPYVVDVYQRDLTIEHYFIGYLLHPYVSLYTGRGCRSKCTFCLWPQTVGGQRYRTRSVDHVLGEIERARRLFPQVKEYFFDDDTFTDDLPRAEAIARGLGKLGVTWSCNAKANVPYETLRVLRENGLRLLLVGYESGSQTILNNIKKGVRVDVARRFTQDARALGITIHGTFIVGLPGETRETIEDTIALRVRDRSAHDPGVDRRAVPGHRALPPGQGERLARGRRPAGRGGRAEERAELPAPAGHGDLRGGGALLPPLLLPPAQDERDGGGRCCATGR